MATWVSMLPFLCADLLRIRETLIISSRQISLVVLINFPSLRRNDNGSFFFKSCFSSFACVIPYVHPDITGRERWKQKTVVNDCFSILFFFFCSNRILSHVALYSFAIAINDQLYGSMFKRSEMSITPLQDKKVIMFYSMLLT